MPLISCIFLLDSTPKRLVSGDRAGLFVQLDVITKGTLVKWEGINGKMLYEVIDFHLPSFGAIGVELSRLPAMLGLMKKFDRAAVLTDKTWMALEEWAILEMSSARFWTQGNSVNG